MQWMVGSNFDKMSHKMRSAETWPDVFWDDSPLKKWEFRCLTKVKLGWGLDSAVSASELVRHERVHEDPANSTFSFKLNIVATPQAYLILVISLAWARFLDPKFYIKDNKNTHNITKIPTIIDL